MNEGSARKVSNAIVTHPEYSQFKAYLLLHGGEPRESFDLEHNAHIAHGITLGVGRMLKQIEELAQALQSAPQKDSNAKAMGRAIAKKAGLKVEPEKAPDKPTNPNKDPDDFDE